VMLMAEMWQSSCLYTMSIVPRGKGLGMHLRLSESGGSQEKEEK
jgi:hypothetical protein